MPIYQLEYTQSDELVDGKVYTDIDVAYDVAEFYSAQNKAMISILEDGAVFAQIKNY